MPWRDSKLTRLLQDSLGGNSRSAIVVTLRDEAENIDETLGTYATQASNPGLADSRQVCYSHV